MLAILICGCMKMRAVSLRPAARGVATTLQYRSENNPTLQYHVCVLSRLERKNDAIMYRGSLRDHKSMQDYASFPEV